MSLHFTGHLSVFCYRKVNDRELAFAWTWHTSCLRMTFTVGASAPRTGHRI